LLDQAANAKALDDIRADSDYLHNSWSRMAVFLRVDLSKASAPP
jgi:hypothetical protein